MFFSCVRLRYGGPKNITAKGTSFETEWVNLLVQQLEVNLTVNNNKEASISITFKYIKRHNGYVD